VSTETSDLVQDLLTPLPRIALVPAVQAILGVTEHQADEIVTAFDEFVAQPLEANFKKLKGRDLAKRNPMIYTARGTRTVDDWVDRVLADKETSAVEAHLGTFLEEVARIVSGGVKPGSGVDLQLEDQEGVVHLYAIQSSSNTKNAGGRKTDVEALKRAARPLRASKRFVEMNIAVLGGRAKTRQMPSDPDITLLGSDEFWARITGIADFRARLLKASVILAPLVKTRAADEVARIKEEARVIFGDSDGGLNLDAVANPPKATRPTKRLAEPDGLE
jgi:Type II restriction endonuclease EcoO109I